MVQINQVKFYVVKYMWEELKKTIFDIKKKRVESKKILRLRLLKNVGRNMKYPSTITIKLCKNHIIK